MNEKMYRVIVPATSANMGAGFDVMGIAMKLYNTISARETDGSTGIKTSDGCALEIIVEDENEFIPTDETNMIYATMQQCFGILGYSPKGLKIVQDSNIPVTRGLGSSSACIVGAIILANAIAGGHMSRGAMIDLATKMEGHPDNVVPAIMGGFVASAIDGETVRFSKIRISDNVNFAIMVPSFPMSTKKARGVLPLSYSREDVVYNIGRASLMALAFATGDYRNLPTAVKDRIHQPYRKDCIAHMDDIFRAAGKLGAKGSYISGAGSTLMSIVLESELLGFEPKMREFLKDIDGDFNLQIFKSDNKGARLI